MKEKKIRLLFLHDQLVCGGAEQALFDLINLLNPEKFEITVLALYRGGDWYQKFLDAGIRVINPWSCQKYSPNPFRKLYNKYIGLWITWSLDHNGRNLVPRCTFQNYDILISYGVWHLQEAAFAGKTKTLRYIHGDIGTNLHYRENILNNLETVKRFDRIICVSKAAEASFRKYTGITENVVSHYNPMDSRRIAELSREQVAFYTDRPLLCAVGRLHKEKGFARLIKIHSQLLKEGIFQDLVIVGGGEEQENLEKLIDELGVKNTVTLAGYTSNPYPYMKMSRMLVCASYTEGLPVVATEALSLGIPVVSSVPSVEESFGGEVCGLITDNDDESLKNGLRKMLTDDAFYRRAKQGAEIRSGAFEGKRMALEIEKELLTLLGESSDI